MVVVGEGHREHDVSDARPLAAGMVTVGWGLVNCPVAPLASSRRLVAWSRSQARVGTSWQAARGKRGGR
jgi:hypothetical protein